MSMSLVQRLLKPLVFMLCLLPMAYLVYGAVYDRLGANPVEKITHETGAWGLYFLLITLAVTPLRVYAGWSWLMPLRRMLGLYAFFYASLHVLTYFWLDHYFEIAAMLEDILKRPYITLGFTAWLLLIPLALTSNRFSIKRLGKRWKKLHRLNYLATLLVVAHFIWLVKADYLEPFTYLLVLIVLLLIRLPWMQSLLTAYKAKKLQV